MALVGLLLLVRGAQAPYRRRMGGAAGFAAAGTLLHLGLLLPAYVGEHPDGPSDLTVLTLNARHGGADAESLVRLARSSEADLVVLVEVTPRLESRLRAAGLARALPYVGGTAGPDASGTMIFSAFPLTDSVALPLEHGALRLSVAAPEPFELVAVHLGQPLKDSGRRWRADWGVLDQVLPDLDGPVVVAGDFNSTLDHRFVRRLLGEGYADAAREANSGWQPTYPQKLPLIAIDHVLSRGGYSAVSTSTASVSGTDHRALVVRLAVR
ncbi:endonuclease/exonuclease/phosphatase (EEP) superfamily protein YafD [Marmoricola sp. OAE513]|uniref:endonuclease/exonuclease/phosphatase family protein n=1 Tax=Marmoricola sp. OAE513 TaxID=2817894 RepID=UPI001AE5380B